MYYLKVQIYLFITLSHYSKFLGKNKIDITLNLELDNKWFLPQSLEISNVFTNKYIKEDSKRKI